MWASRKDNVQDHHIDLGAIGRGLSLCLLTAATPVSANPQGGQVVAGQATIQYGSTTVVTQTSNRAIVNWKEFSIDANEATRINLPNAKSVILNRVTGNNMSQIMGQLSSNGQVFLINPHGIVFGKSARIDVAGLVASTADIHDNDFMAGNYRFQDAPAGSKVINEGTISVSDAGLAALVAPHVENRGIITATLGKVVLGGGSAFTIDLYGDNLITFDATSVVHKNTVDNMGTIEANGGTVMLTVAAADSIVENVINTSGYISAQSVSQQNGNIILQGYDNGTITVSGTLDASGSDPHEVGGVIQLFADYIQLLNGTFIDASGSAGGGHVHIGSDVFHHPLDNPTLNTLGLRTVMRTAQFVYAEADAIVKADAKASGNAGKVVVWGDLATWFYGKISAAAKGLTGDGGHIETSGKMLDVNNIRIDASSIGGETGIWLLDPNNITVLDTGTTNGAFTGTDPVTFAATGASSATLGADLINSNLLTANVVITTTGPGSDAGDITFNNTGTAINWNNSNSLTFLATNDIIFNVANAITKTSGTGVLNLRADSDATSTGTVTFGANTISSTGAVNIFYNPSDYATPTNYGPSVVGVTPTAYMLINTPTQLQAVNTNTSGTYALGTTLNMTAFSFTPITSFNGQFDGNGNSIDNLTINSALANVGLFGTITGGLIHDVTFNNASITSTAVAGAVGTLAGTMSDGQITGVLSGSSAVSGALAAQTGGFIGSLTGGSVDTSSITFSGTVDGESNVGGMIGQQSGGTFANTSGNVSSSGTISGTGSYIGGMLGRVTAGTFTPSNTTFSNAAAVRISAGVGSYVGGIVGSFEVPGTIFSDSNTLSNTGTIGNSTGSINAASTGGIFGRLIGDNVFGLTLRSSSTNSGNVFGLNRTGGLIGEASDIGIANTTALSTTGTSLIRGVDQVGGLIGSAVNTAILSFVSLRAMDTASIQGVGQVGGLIGLYGNPNSPGTETSSFTTAGTVSTAAGVTVSGAYLLGGLIGQLDIGGIFTPSTDVGIATLTNNATVNANVSAVISGSDGVGGLIGNFGVFQMGYNLTNTGTVTVTVGQSQSTGGIAGYVDARSGTDGDNIIGRTLTNQFSGVVTAVGSTNVAGIFGNVFSIEFTGALNSYASISGLNNVGGVLGTANFTSFTAGSATYGDGTNPVTLTLSTNGTSLGGIVGVMGNIFTTGTPTACGATRTCSISNPQVSANVTYIADETTAIIGGLVGELSSLSLRTLNLIGTFTQGSGIAVQGTSVGGYFGDLGLGFAGQSVLTGTFINTANVSAGVSSSESFVGGVIGYAEILSSATLTATLSNTANVTGTGNYVGGLIGFAAGGNYSGSNAFSNTAGTITGASGVGGLVGYMNISSFTRSGTISFTGNVIGGNVPGTGSVGGLIGRMENTTFSPASSLSVINAAISGNASVGGLVGSLVGGAFTPAGGTTLSTNANTTVTGDFDVGGLFGSVNTDSFSPLSGVVTLINNAAVVANASGFSMAINIGGVIGNIEQDIISSFNMTNNGGVSVIDGAPFFQEYRAIGGIFGLVSFSDSDAVTGGRFSGTFINNGAIDGGAAYNVGGIIGHGFNVRFTGISSVSNFASVSGYEHVGGIGGRLSVATRFQGQVTLGNGTTPLTLSINTLIDTLGTRQGTALGGIIGISGFETNGLSETRFNNVTINANVNYVADETTQTIGGLVGFLSAFRFSINSFTSHSDITVQGAEVGGYVGTWSGASSQTIQADFANTRNITGGASVGGIIGKIGNNSNVVDVTFTGSMTNSGVITGIANNRLAGDHVGGLIGRVSGPSLPVVTFSGTDDFNTLSSSQVIGVSNVGGLVGGMYKTTFNRNGVDNIYSLGTVSGSGNNVGGLFGYIDSSVTVFSPASGSINLINNATVTHTAGTGTFSAVGGLVGRFGANITSGYNMINNGNVTANNSVNGTIDSVAGVVGVLQNGTFSASLTNLANITGPRYVGGLAGTLQSGKLTGLLTVGDTLQNSYTLALTSGGTYLGGIAGRIQGSVTGNHIDLANVTINENTIFSVAGSTYIGGVVGQAGTGAKLTGTFIANTLSNILIIDDAINVGAIIGQGNNAVLGSLTNSTELNGSSVGMAGIAGHLTQSTVSGNFSNTADITGDGSIAGLFANTDNTLYEGTFTNTGVIDPPLFDYAGGITAHSTDDAFGGTLLGATFTNSNDVVGLQYVGGLFGAIDGTSTTFTNDVTMNNIGGTLTGTNYLGGAIGQVGDGVQVNAVFNISNTTLVSSGSGLGGFVGRLTDGSDLGGSGTLADTVQFSPLAGASDIGTAVGILENNASLSDIANFTLPDTLTIANATTYVGGYIGRMNNVANFNDAINSVINVTALTSNYVAGVVGNATGSTLTSLSYSGIVQGNNYVAGVLAEMVMSNASEIFLCCQIFPATSLGGSVIGNDYVGGLVASIDATSVLSRSYNNSLNSTQGVFAADGAQYVGGIAAENAGQINNVIFGGVIHLNGTVNYAGGIAGINTASGSILSSLSGGNFDTSLGNAIFTGGLVGRNLGALPGTGQANASFYSTSKFAAGIGAVGEGTSGGVAGNYINLWSSSTFGAPYNWNFGSIWTEQAPVAPIPSFYVTLQWAGLNAAIPDLAPPPSPTPTPGPPNFGQQYITVEQILDNNETTGLEWYLLRILDTFGLYEVAMKNYSIPFKVAIFYEDPSTPQDTANEAEQVLRREGSSDPL